MKAICVSPNELSDIWPKVSGLIRQAMYKGGLGSFQVVEPKVLSGDYLLWLALQDNKLLGAAVTCLRRQNGSKACVIVACGGRDVANWIGCIEKIEDYARAEGCDCVRLYGREGWVHFLPPTYRPKRVVIERML